MDTINEDCCKFHTMLIASKGFLRCVYLLDETKLACSLDAKIIENASFNKLNHSSKFQVLISLIGINVFHFLIIVEVCWSCDV